MCFFEKIRELGWKRFCSKSLWIGLRMIWRKDHLFLIKRSTAPYPFPNRKRYRILPMDEANIHRFASACSYDVDLFLNRLRAGLFGYFVYNEERNAIYAYHWLAIGRDYHEPYDNYTFRIRPDEAYIFDGYVPPQFRGQTGALQVCCFSFDYLRERNIKTVIAAVDRMNPRAWKFQLHLGFEIAGCIEIKRLFLRPVSAREVDSRPLLTQEIIDAQNHYDKQRMEKIEGGTERSAPARMA